MQWNDDNYIRQMERAVGQRVQSAGYHLVSAIRKNISIPSRTVGYHQGKSGAVKKVLGARGSNRSKPGEYVHKDFGNLRQSIAQQYDPETLTSRVGSAIKYARFIELGTSKMRPRKMLRATLDEERESIRQIIEHGGASSITVGE